MNKRQREISFFLPVSADLAIEMMFRENYLQDVLRLTSLALVFFLSLFFLDVRSTGDEGNEREVSFLLTRFDRLRLLRKQLMPDLRGIFR